MVSEKCTRAGVGLSCGNAPPPLPGRGIGAHASTVALRIAWRRSCAAPVATVHGPVGAEKLGMPHGVYHKPSATPSGQQTTQTPASRWSVATTSGATVLRKRSSAPAGAGRRSSCVHGLRFGSPVGDPALHPWLHSMAPLGPKSLECHFACTMSPPRRRREQADDPGHPGVALECSHHERGNCSAETLLRPCRGGASELMRPRVALRIAWRRSCAAPVATVHGPVGAEKLGMPHGVYP